MKRLRTYAKTITLDFALEMSYLVEYVAALEEDVTILWFGHRLKSQVYIIVEFLRIAQFQ